MTEFVNLSFSNFQPWDLIISKSKPEMEKEQGRKEARMDLFSHYSRVCLYIDNSIQEDPDLEASIQDRDSKKISFSLFSIVYDPIKANEKSDNCLFPSLTL